MTPADPVAAFEEIAATYRRCVWLDGGGARAWSRRRSIIGWLEDDDVSLTYDAARREVTRHAGGRAEVVGDDPFAALEVELRSGSVNDQWFGYFGYGARPDLPAAPDPELPDAVWMRPSHVRMFEHGAEEGGRRAPDGPPVEERKPAAGDLVAADALITLEGLPGSGGGLPRFGGGFSDSPDGPSGARRPPSGAEPVPNDYRSAFDRVQEHLHAGNTYEVNLTHRRRVRNAVDPASAYLRLRALNPAPYAGFLQHDVDAPKGRAWLLSSSPERYALVTGDRTLETKPIKGTTPRGSTPEEDAAARRHLATDPKYRAENLMIVDLLRNDLATVCEVGSVEVPVLMDVESYASVHQLVSTVRGRLRDDVSTVGALRALFPAGSMTGAPKLRTMEVIEEVESTPRGAYAGAFGWVSGDGRADLGVVIRTLTTAGDGSYTLGTGGGITVQSDVGEEYAETRWKVERLLAALGSAPLTE